MDSTTTAPKLIGTVRNPDDTDERYAIRAEMDAERATEKVMALRELADLVTDRGVVMPQVHTYSFTPDVTATWEASDVETFRDLVRTLGSTVTSPWRKESRDGRYRVERTLTTTSLRLVVVAAWGACQKVEVGTRIETVEKVIEPARTRPVEEEVPVYEWRCPESILTDIDGAL